MSSVELGKWVGRLLWQPGQASTSAPYFAAPGQDGAAVSRRPWRGPTPALLSQAHARAYQAPLAAWRGGTVPMPPPCQTPATRVQAAGTATATALVPPPPPSNSARLIKVLKRPAGNQLSFSNLALQGQAWSPVSATQPPRPRERLRLAISSMSGQLTTT